MMLRFVRNIVFNIILIICLNINYIQAQYKNIKFDHLTIEDGLSQSSVNCILKDKQGFMWFCTDNGLNRYDGSEFEIYQNNHKDTTSISGNHISCMLEDHEGKLWVGTFSNGLNKFDREKGVFTKFIHDEDNKNSISHNLISCLYEDSKNNLWIGTFGGGLNLYQRNTNSFKYYKQDALIINSIGSNYISSIAQDSKDNIWMADSNGKLIRFDQEKEIFTNIIYSENYNTRVNNITFGRIIIDSKDNIWITSENGIYIYNTIQNSFKHITSDGGINSLNSNVITDILEDEDGIFWITTDHGGINIYDTQNNTFNYLLDNQYDNTSLSNSQVYCLYKDDEDNYWAGNYNGGVNVYYKNKYKFDVYSTKLGNDNSLSYPSVLALCEDKQGNIWIGTDGGGLNLFNPQNQSFKHFKHNPKQKNSVSSNIITDIFEDKSGNLWIGTYLAGLNLFDKTNNKFIHFVYNPDDENSLTHNSIWAITQDQYDNLWIGTSNGLDFFNPKTRIFKHYKHDADNANSLGDNYIYSLSEDSKQNLWIGIASRGANMLVKENNTFIRYTHDCSDSCSITNNEVFTICEDSKNNIWFGTSNGLSRLNRKNNLFSHFTKNEGLPDNIIKSILADNNSNLWIATNRGLSKFNPNNKTFKNYDISDGLLSNEFNYNSCLLSKSGKLYFGCTKGFISFFPDSIKENEKIPNVVFTDFQIFNKPVVIGAKKSPLKKHINECDEIILSYKQSVFTIKYSALNYQSSEKNQYAYKMEGFDMNWNYVGNEKKTTYTNLDHGEYIFKVKGSNNDGVWNEDGKSIKIIIIPPWWKTLWFKISVALFIIIAVVGTYLYKMNTLEKQKQILEQNVKERTQDLQYANVLLKEHKEELQTTNSKLKKIDKFKEEMTSMIVHDLKNPLNVIINVSESFSVKKQLADIKQAGKQMLNLVMNILDVHKYENTKMKIKKSDQSLYKLSHNAISEVQFLAKQKNIEIRNNIETDIGIIGEKEVAERIFVNLFTNAIKYTPLNGNITIDGEMLTDIDLQTEHHKSKQIKILVSDTGQGVPAYQLSKIFDKFAQVDAKKSGLVHSTGLGLTFCKMAVEAHNGKIGVESKEDEGTTFWFTLPISDIKFKENQIENIKKSDTITLSETDKTVLEPYILELQDVMVYETTAIANIINKIEIDNSKALEKWKEEINNCLYLLDNVKYSKLINKTIS